MGFLYGLLFFELLLVAYLDFSFKRISNYWSIFHLVIIPFLFFFFPNSYQFGWGHFIYSLLFFCLGYIFFLFHIVGAGDSKYLASFFLFLPTNFQEDALYCLILSTIIVGSLLLTFNITKNIKTVWRGLKILDWSFLKLVFGKRISFAPVILFSWVYFGWRNKEILF